jgi:hypothetical protein
MFRIAETLWRVTARRQDKLQSHRTACDTRSRATSQNQI